MDLLHAIKSLLKPRKNKILLKENLYKALDKNFVKKISFKTLEEYFLF